MFVGRDREAAELVAGPQDATDGQGRPFLIAGQPGIGKTGLAEQLAGHATTRGFKAFARDALGSRHTSGPVGSWAVVA